MALFFSFIKDGLKSATAGTWRYHLWMGALSILMIAGMLAYSQQLRFGLSVTGMNDHVSWGLYISNFTFLVGLAAAAVMVVLPAYVIKDLDFSQAVLIGEGVAVAALCMCLAFVVADMGGPTRLWHMLPFVGYFNWPSSMLTWDVIVLNGYLGLNLCIPLYILLCKYKGTKPNKKYYLPFIFLSIGWALAIHLVTAFLYAGLPARPFWNNALLGPRFLASAFAGGPAFIIVVLVLIRSRLNYKIDDETINKLALIITVAAQVNLVMLGSELFKEFYQQTHHSISAQYLFFGLNGKTALVPWIWGSIGTNVLCTILLSIHPIRTNTKLLVPIAIVLFLAIWVDKGLGLIIPGFIPSPLGELVEYTPTWVESTVTAGIWAMGFFILTVLIKVALPIEKGYLRFRAAPSAK